MSDAHQARRGTQERSAAGDHNPWLIAIVVSIATFMLVLDTSIASVALLNIAGDLAADYDQATWVITSYLVANAVIIPVSGWLAGVIGRKRYYMMCVAGFTASSLLCGLAWNLQSLIFFRILQGLSGGGMAPSEQSILADTFPPEKRSQAFALYGIAVIIAPTIGPTLGGWLTDHFSWHWIFFINVPFGILSVSLVQWLLVEPPALEEERRARLARGVKVDWIGFLLVALWLGCQEIVLDKGQQDDWFASTLILSFTIVAALSFISFIPWELSRRDPIVDVRLVFTRQFGTAFAVMVAVGAILFGTTQILPQMMQESFSYTAYLSGLALMPGGLSMLVMMPLAGQVSNYIQAKYLIAGGMFIIALSMWHMTGLDANSSFGWLSWARVYQMIGLPFLFIPINNAAYAGLAPDKTNQASAQINMARNLGGSFGISIANTELARRSQFHHERLVSHVHPSSEAYRHTTNQVMHYFTTHGASAVQAKGLTMAWIGRTIARQASLLAYIDVFWIGGIFAVIMVPLILLFLRPVKDYQNRPPVH
ncbi:MAG TPA: DHA2 family efflux MFS transporter permease subunit [Pseudolabrys sp.]|nr:DHA2 family efflux MFS transporter permease subunit [Pseudolabrys sp.]